MEFKTTEVDGQTLKGEYFLIQFTFPKEGLERIDGQDRIEEGVKIGAVGLNIAQNCTYQSKFFFRMKSDQQLLTFAIRVMETNNSTIWRRMWVRRQGASTGAYRDMCRRMERR
jgi:hypothetical protein